MPVIIPPVLQPPYDEIETILRFARVIANDAAISIDGNLLNDNQPYIMQMASLAWRKLQDRLSNNNLEEFPEEVIITGIPAQNSVPFADPAIQCYLGYETYWDGLGHNPLFWLPQDMQIPLRLWERPTGQNAQFIPMSNTKDNIPSGIVKTGYNRIWEWRDDAIWFPGANQALDLRIRYKKLFSDLAVPTNTNPVPLIRCAVAMAYLIVEILALSRGSVVLPAFQAEKEDAIKQLINQTTRKKQRVNFRRQPYSRRGRGWSF